MLIKINIIFPIQNLILLPFNKQSCLVQCMLSLFLGLMGVSCSQVVGPEFVVNKLPSQSLISQKADVELPTSTVFKYQFKPPRRQPPNKQQLATLSSPEYFQTGTLRHDEYISANGHVCRKLAYTTAGQWNVVCFIGNRWLRTADISVDY